MFWDKAAGFYDLFEDKYNGEVNRKLVQAVADMIEESDRVLECACGTGMLSRGIGENCMELIATDFSDGMLRQTKKNCVYLPNVKVKRANIMELKCRNSCFDKVVAGNVIHLLDDPYGAINELLRVCKPGGKVIIPTYVNNENSGSPSLFIKALEKCGADFKKQFDYRSYKKFFDDAGITGIEYMLIEGKMPCAIAVITKK